MTPDGAFDNLPSDNLPSDTIATSRDALNGLAVGDAFGAQHFVPDNLPALRARRLPPGEWPWTDDTEMACSVQRAIMRHAGLDQDELARSFALRHDFDRGYGPAMNRMLRLSRQGGDWLPTCSTGRDRGATAPRCGWPRSAPAFRPTPPGPPSRPRCPRP